MNKKFLYAGIGLLLSCTTFAQKQDKDAVKFSAVINKDVAYKHLSVLASDEYEGRETGTRGAWMAAEYIKNQFKSFGLTGPVKDNSDPYFQPVGYSSFPVTGNVVINGKTLEAGKDYYFQNNSVSTKGTSLQSASILFAGYGISKDGYNDYEGQNVAGKIVMVFATGDPTVAPPPAPQAGQQARRQPIAGPTANKVKYLLDNKAAGVILINPILDNVTPQLARMINGNPILTTAERLKNLDAGAQLPVLNVSTAVANQILAAANLNVEGVKGAITASKKPSTQLINVSINAQASKKEQKIRAENVLGFLEGSDPKLKEEVLVISSHYDHIGLVADPNAKDKVNNGADDDGSGTTGVLLIAEAFANAKKAGKGPKRSILFICVVGEEKGLLGSEWYGEYPVFPLKNTITNLNIDMIGRGDAAHPDNNFVYIIGSNMLSDDLDRIGKEANNTYTKMFLDEKHNNRTDPERFYYRSDHYNFAKHNIPVIFYFNGVHDDYHAPGDEVDKIDFPMLAKRSQLAYYTAWMLTNGKDRPVVNKDADGKLIK